MFRLIFIIFLLFPTLSHAQYPTVDKATPELLLRFLYGFSPLQMERVYVVFGKELKTVDIVRDTIWSIPSIDFPVRKVAYINETHIPRPAYAFEILSHYRENVINSWRAVKEDSLKSAVLKTVVIPSF